MEFPISVADCGRWVKPSPPVGFLVGIVDHLHFSGSGQRWMTRRSGVIGVGCHPSGISLIRHTSAMALLPIKAIFAGALEFVDSWSEIPAGDARKRSNVPGGWRSNQPA